METKTVQRDKRKVTSWRLVEEGTFTCGHAGTVTTEWHLEGDGGAARELIREFAKPCPDCRWVALGGPRWAISKVG